jgi:poly(3-hydroxybutyrate) depolymerase
MMDKMKADYKIDATNVYITGLSAGGAMTAVMIACHPDQFAGAGICSGLPHRTATTLSEAFTAMYVGNDVNMSPTDWGNRVRNETQYSGRYPKVSIWHGAADKTVVPVNEQELMEQWTAVHKIDRIPDFHTNIQLAACTVTNNVYKDKQGNALVETYVISGMDHATAIDPGSKPEQGGVPSQYVKDEGIFSSYHMARFWGLIRTPPESGCNVPAKERKDAVLKLLGGADAATVANGIVTDPAVTVEVLESWKQKFIDAGTEALAP